jgi:DNA-binding CsgD family transcriptional regulator
MNRTFSVFIIFILLLPATYADALYAQGNILSNPYYIKALEYLNIQNDTSQKYITLLKKRTNLNCNDKSELKYLEVLSTVQSSPLDSSIEKLNIELDKLHKCNSDNPDLKSKLLILTGSLYASNSDIDKGINLILQADSLLSGSENKDLKDLCRIKLIEAHRIKKQFKIGFRLLYRILDKKNLSERNRASAYGRMAAYYNECSIEDICAKNNAFTIQNKIDSILKYSYISLKLAQTHSYKDLIAAAYNEIGQQLIHANAPVDSSFVCLEKASVLFKEINYIIDGVNTSNNLMFAYVKNQQFNTAIELGNSLLKNRVADEYPQIYRRTYTILSDAYSALKEYKKAKECIEKAYEIDKTLFNVYLNKQTTALALKYDYDLKETELKHEQNLRIIEKKDNRFKVAVLISILLLLSAFIVILVFLFQLRKKIYAQKQDLLSKNNEILNNKLTYQNKLLTVNTLFIMKYNVIFDEISEDLRKLEYINKNDFLSQLKSITQSIKVKKKIEAWDDFEKSFIGVYIDFYKNLLTHFPSLNSKELRFCALIKLNLTTKEISKITGVSVRSVETSRYRLKKKMQLPEHEDLYCFIQKKF